MKTVGIPARFEPADMLIAPNYTSVLVVPMKTRGHVQTFYLLDLSQRRSTRVLVDLKDQTKAYFDAVEQEKETQGIDASLYPFGLSQNAFREFCVAPHSFLRMDGEKVLCGMDLFNRYEIIDVTRGTVELCDPEVGDEWLTASPSYDAKGSLYFGSTPLAETISTIHEPTRQSLTHFWKIDTDRTLTELWNGRSGALLHQMRVAGTPDVGEIKAPPPPRIVYVERDGTAAEGPVEGAAYVNFNNIKTGIIYKVGPFDVPAHTEVHPDKPATVYLTEHNFRMESGHPVILGNAAVYRFELGESGPSYTGKFTDPSLYRMTSAEMFRRPDGVFMALTGYPDTVFIVNADTLELVRKIRFRDCAPVDLTGGPYTCVEPNYGCQISADGDSLFVIESTTLKVFDVSTGALKDECRYTRQGDPEFMGHSFSFVR